MKKEVNNSRVRSTGVVSVAVMCSRVLGLVREVLFASFFGSTKWTSCFYLAFKIPNLLRDLFAEGALSTAFVTVFSKKLKQEGENSAWALGNKMLSLAAVFMGLVVVAGIVLAPWIVEVFASFSDHKFDEEMKVFTTLLVRVMYPFIAVISLSALVMGMLNARRVFGIPALASSFFNIGSMVSGFSLGWWMDRDFGPKALLGFAIGVVIGGLCQLAIQVPSLWRQGFRLKADFAWRDSGVQKTLRLLWPAVIAGSAVQVNVLVNSLFAFRVSDQAASWLQYAFRLMQFPLGIFGVAVGVVTLPAISRAVAEGGKYSMEFKDILARGIGLVIFLTLPCMLGLVLLAEPIISLIYERGRFDLDSTVATAAALRFYALGLVFYACIKVVQPAFYAIDRRIVPMLVGFGSIGVNFMVNYFFVVVLKKDHAFLALSTGIVALVNCVLLYLLMWREIKGVKARMLAWNGGKYLISGLLMCGVVWLGIVFLLQDFSDFGLLKKVARLFSVMGTSAVVYFGASYVLRVEEVREIFKIIQRRLFST